MTGTIKIQGKEIFYQIINQERREDFKPFLVFLHEGLGSIEQWRDFPQIIATACGLPALIYDRYGYGKSEVKPEPNDEYYMHREASEFLPELLDKLGITGQIIPVGHSDGGTIALLFAAFFPERALAVISECDHVLCEDITIDGVRGVVNDYQKGKLKKLLSAYHGEKTDTLFKSWTGLWLSDKALIWNILHELPKIKSPVLNIQGVNDNYGSVEQMKAKLDHCGGHVQINLLPDCGHVPHYEKKEIVGNLMKEFINRVL